MVEIARRRFRRRRASPIVRQGGGGGAKGGPRQRRQTLLGADGARFCLGFGWMHLAEHRIEARRWGVTEPQGLEASQTARRFSPPRRGRGCTGHGGACARQRHSDRTGRLPHPGPIWPSGRPPVPLSPSICPPLRLVYTVWTCAREPQTEEGVGLPRSLIIGDGSRRGSDDRTRHSEPDGRLRPLEGPLPSRPRLGKDEAEGDRELHYLARSPREAEDERQDARGGPVGLVIPTPPPSLRPVVATPTTTWLLGLAFVPSRRTYICRSAWRVSHRAPCPRGPRACIDISVLCGVVLLTSSRAIFQVQAEGAGTASVRLCSGRCGIRLAGLPVPLRGDIRPTCQLFCCRTTQRSRRTRDGR